QRSRTGQSRQRPKRPLRPMPRFRSAGRLEPVMHQSLAELLSDLDEFTSPLSERTCELGVLGLSVVLSHPFQLLDDVVQTSTSTTAQRRLLSRRLGRRCHGQELTIKPVRSEDEAIAPILRVESRTHKVDTSIHPNIVGPCENVAVAVPSGTRS